MENYMASGRPSPIHMDQQLETVEHNNGHGWMAGGDQQLELDTSHFQPQNVEEIYANVHKSIEQIRSTVSRHTHFAPGRIKEENRKVVEKLSSLEHEVVRRSSSTPTDSIPSPSRVPHVPQLEAWLDLESLDIFQSAAIQDPSFLDYFDGGSLEPAAPQKQQSGRPPVAAIQTTSASYRTTNSSSRSDPKTPSKRRRLCPKGKGSDSSSSSNAAKSPKANRPDDATCIFTVRLQDSPKLAQKALKIGSPEIVAAAQEFAMRLQDPNYNRCSPGGPRGTGIGGNNGKGNGFMPEPYSFPKMAHIGDGSGFLRMLPKLALAIECNIFGEQDHKIKKRIALAHFYHAYTLAQENPQTFLSWCDDQNMSRSMLPKGSYKSMVQHRFADLMFPLPSATDGRSPMTGGASSTLQLGDGTTSSGWRKARVTKIQMWRKSGKHWALLIMRFGYGILLLMPPSLTDEDLRLAHDDEMAAILDFIESRKHLFADALENANNLFRSEFFSEEQSGLIQETGGVTETMDWEGLLQSPIRPRSYASLR